VTDQKQTNVLMNFSVQSITAAKLYEWNVGLHLRDKWDKSQNYRCL